MQLKVSSRSDTATDQGELINDGKSVGNLPELLASVSRANSGKRKANLRSHLATQYWRPYASCSGPTTLRYHHRQWSPLICAPLVQGEGDATCLSALGSCRWLKEKAT